MQGQGDPLVANRTACVIVQRRPPSPVDVFVDNGRAIGSQGSSYIALTGQGYPLVSTALLPMIGQRRPLSLLFAHIASLNASQGCSTTSHGQGNSLVSSPLLPVIERLQPPSFADLLFDDIGWLNDSQGCSTALQRQVTLWCQPHCAQ